MADSTVCEFVAQVLRTGGRTENRADTTDNRTENSGNADHRGVAMRQAVRHATRGPQRGPEVGKQGKERQTRQTAPRGSNRGKAQSGFRLFQKNRFCYSWPPLEAVEGDSRRAMSARRRRLRDEKNAGRKPACYGKTNFAIKTLRQDFKTCMTGFAAKRRVTCRRFCNVGRSLL